MTLLSDYTDADTETTDAGQHTLVWALPPRQPERDTAAHVRRLLLGYRSFVSVFADVCCESDAERLLCELDNLITSTWSL